MRRTNTVDRHSTNARLAVRNSFSGFFAIVTQLISNSFAFFVIARIPGLSVSDFGKLTYAFALAQLFAVLFEYGLGPYIARESAKLQIRRERFEEAAYGLHLFLMGSGLFVFMAFLTFKCLDQGTLAVCQWVGASVFMTSAVRFFFAYYQGRERISLEFYGTCSEAAIIVSVVAAAFVQHSDVLTVAKYFFYGRLIAWVMSYFLFGLTVRWLIPCFDFSIYKKILVEAAPFGLMFVIALAITSIDTIMLREFAAVNPDHQVGLYQAAVRLILIPTILAMVITKVFLPQLSRMGAENQDGTVPILRRINDVLHTVGLLAGVFVFFRAESLVNIAYGDQFRDSAALVKVLAITLMLRFGAAYNLYFTLKDRMWMRAFFASIALLSAVILNFVLVPLYGVMGVAYASVLTHLIYWFPFLYAMKKLEGDYLFGWRWARAILTATLFAILLWVSKGLSLVLVLPISILYIGFVIFYFLERSYKGALLLSLSLNKK
jgi:O-antigen/teichoic acid export membrane protein